MVDEAIDLIKGYIPLNIKGSATRHMLSHAPPNNKLLYIIYLPDMLKVLWKHRTFRLKTNSRTAKMR